MESEKLTLETLEQIVAEMRRLGVTRYKSGNLEIDLGKAPTTAPEPERPPPEQQGAELRAKLAEFEKERSKRTLFAATSMRPSRRNG